MKRATLLIVESSMIRGAVSLRHPEGGSIREALGDGGFKPGDRVAVILESELPAACGPGCQNGGKCWEP